MHEHESQRTQGLGLAYAVSSEIIKNPEKSVPELEDLVAQITSVVNEQAKEISELQVLVLKISDRRDPVHGIPVPPEPMAESISSRLFQQLSHLRRNRYKLAEINSQLYKIVG